jgi:site-specific DNA-cytosine methylase
VDSRPFTVLSLCAGVGGLDLGVRLAEPAARTVCFVEIEAYACAILAARMAENALDPAPVWTNLRTFDGKPWRGTVDCITAGYPCQPFSVAGKQRGAEDPRHLWPDVFRVVREIRPAFCFFENVGGHLRLGFEQVHDDLRSVGYRVKAGLFTAQEVGAPHKRERLFILAYAESAGDEREAGNIPAAHGGSDGSLFRFADDAGEFVADGACLLGQRPCPERDCSGQPEEKAGGIGGLLADPDSAGFQETRPELQPVWSGGEQLPMGNAEYNGSSAATLGGSDGENAGADRSARGATRPSNLREQIVWPTPRAQKTSSENPERWIARRQAGQVSTPPLAMAAFMWPTVTTQDAKNNAGPSQFERNTKPLNVEATLHSSRLGQTETGTASHKVLNPQFVEWLMGWPIGWTEFAPVGTAWCRWLPLMRGALSWLVSRQNLTEKCE